MGEMIVAHREHEYKNKQNLRNTIKTTKYMFGLVWKEKHGKIYTFLRVVLTLFNVVPLPVYTVLPGLIINELTGERQINKLILYVGVLAFTSLASQIINRTLDRYLTKLNLTLSAKFAKDFNYHTANMDYEMLEKPDIQVMRRRVNSTFTNAVDVIININNLLSAVLSLVVISSIIITLNLAIIVLIIVIIYVNSLVTKWVNKQQYLNSKELSKYDRYLSSLSNVLDFIQYAKEVRLFNLKAFFAEMMFEKRIEVNKIHLKDKTNQIKAGTFSAVTNFIQQIALYAYLIYNVIEKGLAIGSMTVYMSAVGQFAGSLSAVVNEYTSLTNNGLKVQEMIEFMNIPLRQQETGDKTPSFDKSSIIEFKNVSFKYPGSENYALKNISLKIRGDEKLCIVGANGSGKSTFIKLLTRLYFPTEGDILLNGVNINEYDYIKYQRLFAPIFQDFSLYVLSLKENIVLNNEYNKERLDEVCTKSDLNSLVNKLPRNYDTPVFKVNDDDGFQPSGGEGQRIAIARAIYHDAAIFLLDEPTAALDPIAEYEIYTQFNNTITDKCAILITHRLSAVQLADKVAVFDKGGLIEYGTHKELYKKAGVYTEMYDKQAAFYVDGSKNINGIQS